MGRQNIAFLYGRVEKPPIIKKNSETGEYVYGMVYLDTVRSNRHVDDDVRYIRHSYPLIMSQDKAVLDRISEWKENDIVLVKGVITSKAIPKASFCSHCADNGVKTRNQIIGNLIYITPIYVRREAEFGEDKQAAVEHLIENREISNQIYVLGTLIRDPKLFTTKKGLQITQYQVAINRKLTIRADDPSIRTDWPVVKSYGEQALNDKLFLKYQADAIIDGFLQARNVKRKIKCSCCGQIYDYDDHCMEIVPYDVEYLRGFRSKDEIEEEEKATLEDLKQQLFTKAHRDKLEPELMSDDVSDGEGNAGQTA